MLLNHVTGSTSYEDIRTLTDGILCNTYKEAARKRGLLEEDQECDDWLTQAASCTMDVISLLLSFHLTSQLTH